MKYPLEKPLDIAARMRKLASGMTNPSDVEAITRYADWIEASPNADQLQDLGEDTPRKSAGARHG